MHDAIRCQSQAPSPPVAVSCGRTNGGVGGGGGSTFEHGVAQDCVFGFGPLSAFAGHGRQKDEVGKTERFFFLHRGYNLIALRRSANTIVISPEVGGGEWMWGGKEGGVLKLISSERALIPFF